MNENADIEQKLLDLESKLIEQEHRPITLIWNYLKRKTKWEKGDKRRNAATRAILWRLFFSPTTLAVVSGGFMAIFSIYFLYQQNQILNTQNKLFKIQNKRVEQQTHLNEASRRSSQVFIMGDVLSDLTDELKDLNNDKDTLTGTLVGRIISLSKAMKPYKYLEGDSLIKKPLSPERGQLLISLLESKIDPDFRLWNILGKSDFSNSELQNVNFNKKKLIKMYLNDSDFSNSKLMNADLREVLLNGSNLYNANFRKSDLMGAALSFSHSKKTNFYEANLMHVKFNNSYLEGANFDYSDASYANFNGADLSNTKFRGANLCFANFDRANLQGADLMYADLRGTDISNVISLDSVKLNRFDWLDYIKDSLELSGSDKIYKSYRIDTINYFGTNHRYLGNVDRKWPILIKK